MKSLFDDLDDAPDLPQALDTFASALQAAQVDLPPEAAQILRDNLWELYEGAPVTDDQIAGLVEQIARDTATLTLDDDLIHPSREFYQTRIAQYTETVRQLRK